MLTDGEIQNLISLPKMITSKEPARGYGESNTQRRCKLSIVAASDSNIRFEVFIRRHIRFIENFTIGLTYRTNLVQSGVITLARYNGAHGETSRSPDGHFATPHIHRVTQTELGSGSIQPQAASRELTAQYSTYEEALAIFFVDTAVENYRRYFPEAGQMRLIEGC